MKDQRVTITIAKPPRFDEDEMIDALEFFLPEAGAVLSANGDTFAVTIAVKAYSPMHVGQLPGVANALMQIDGIHAQDIRKFEAVPADE